MSEWDLGKLAEKFEHVLSQLEQARRFNKQRYQAATLEAAARLLPLEGGVELLFEHAARYDRAGLFVDTAWDNPETLLPGLVRTSLESGDRVTVTIELLSELRLLALARGLHCHAGVPGEQARHFLTQVLALNLDYLLAGPAESSRVRLGNSAPAVDRVFRLLLAGIDFADILGSLVTEIQRMLAQRPIQVDSIKSMITQIAVARARGDDASESAGAEADLLVRALFGPSSSCADDPGLDVFEQRLAALEPDGLLAEARQFAEHMHGVGLVSDYHAQFLRWALASGREELLADALGLSSTGIDVLRCYQQLVHRLVGRAVHPQTAQCVYSLAMMLESGVLYAPPIAPALWRQIDLPLSPHCETLLTFAFGNAVPATDRLLAGALAILGQPLGIGQGNNPTCQSARAISMWAYNDPDYLLYLIQQAARFDEVVMHFEGTPISSAGVAATDLRQLPLDTDPVSVLLVPHLDKIYHHMGQLCADRGDDPHRWVNPEFHGWWVGRSFNLAVDLESGQLTAYRDFISRFYRSYHPYYNGNQPIIHPQPAGLAITDSNGAFVGWHAITLIRVALDQEGAMRVYFFNPNNDSGQNWGGGVQVSTDGHGERHGESSLPFAELVSRLYLFHAEAENSQAGSEPERGEVTEVMQMAVGSWASSRVQGVPAENEEKEN
ncbi:hypothetical protein [Microbulbifer guangxiensis]|uniref:hypothetical protein n=1 Tax=Microbulbifer guangxiensis TaxID=2904249 RepID=UPI001F460B42|nr:hypothetical protein [Microbulbifer guangxiensis]